MSFLYVRLVIDIKYLGGEEPVAFHIVHEIF